MVPPENGPHVKATVEVPLDAYMIDFVFSEIEDGGIFDNKDGMDYHIPVFGGLIREPPMHTLHIAVEMAPIVKDLQKQKREQQKGQRWRSRRIGMAGGQRDPRVGSSLAGSWHGKALRATTYRRKGNIRGESEWERAEPEGGGKLEGAASRCRRPVRPPVARRSNQEGREAEDEVETKRREKPREREEESERGSD